MDQSEIDAHYLEVFKSHLLPSLGRMMRSQEQLSVQERGEAIKSLADGSLAFTGSGAEWSAALGNNLRLKSPGAGLFKPSNVLSRSGAPLTSQDLQSRRIQTAKERFTRQFKLSSSQRLSRSYRALRLRTRRRRRISPPTKALRSLHPQQEEDSQQLVRSRVKALQRLVPGGNNMSCSVLLNETADYMMFLKLQVGVLQSLTSAIEKSQKTQLHAAASGA